MTTTNCPTCGCAPCISICPEADPYAGDQAREEADYSFGARYDRFDGYDRGDLDYDQHPDSVHSTPTHLTISFVGSVDLDAVAQALAEGEHDLGAEATAAGNALICWPNIPGWVRVGDLQALPF